MFDALIGWPGGDWQASLKLLGTVTVLYLLLLWLASILWAYRDIRSRTVDPISQAIGVGVVALMPLFGVALYLIVRPSETLTEAYERELEQEAIRSELHSIGPCPNCRRAIERDFVVCPYCRTQVREECPHCRKLLALEWRHCPYCGTSRPVREPMRASAAQRYDPQEASADVGTRTRPRPLSDEPTRPQPRSRPNVREE